MFNNVDSTSVVININGKEIMITPAYWFTLSASIAILSTVTNSYSQFLQCLQVRGAFGSSPYTPSISPMLQMYEKYLGWKLYHSTCFLYGTNVIDITRNRQVIQLYSSLVRSSNLKFANQKTICSPQ